MAKKTLKQKKIEWRVIANYSSILYPEFDKKIFAAAKRYSDGSGMGNGQRDHSWYRKTKAGAKALASRLKKLRNGICVSIERVEA